MRNILIIFVIIFSVGALTSVSKAAVPDINKPDPKTEYTKLIQAVLDKNKDLVKVLLRHQEMDPNAPGKYNNKALGIAAEDGLTAIVKLLLKHPKTNVTLAGDMGITPLYAASNEGHKNIVELLLAKNSSANYVNAQDENGVTAIAAATQNGFVDVIEVLAAHGADVNLPDNDGETPLHKAYWYTDDLSDAEKRMVVAKLKTLGANKTARTNEKSEEFPEGRLYTDPAPPEDE